MKTPLLFASLCAVASATIATAATYVGGLIDGPTWNATGSPYLVTNNLRVNRLTIQPGVEVRFLGSYVMEVTSIGLLRANGTACGPILFTTNVGVRWQGIFFNGSGAGSFLTHCRIEGSTNSGVRITNSTPALTNCTIAKNSTKGSGGGVYISVESGTPMFHGCTISNNTCEGGGGGGGVYVAVGTGSLRNCDIAGNSAPNTWGGGVSVWTGATLSLVNCKLRNNTTRSDLGSGGGMAHGGAKLLLVNCTVANNFPQALAGALGDCAITNSIVYGNNSGGPQFWNSPTVVYSDVQNGYAGTGNISDYPGLCSANLALYTDSPCIDKGDPSAIYNDGCRTNTDCLPTARGTARNDMGAYGGPGACAWPAPCLESLQVTGPESQNKCLGETAMFFVRATGMQPIAYQWYFNGAILPDETTTLLLRNNLRKDQAGTYSVVVSNLDGSVTNAAQLVLSDACIQILCVAGMFISGEPGARYVLKYTNELGRSAPISTWIPLATNNAMPTRYWYYVDTNSPFNPQRFYAAEKQ